MNKQFKLLKLSSMLNGAGQSLILSAITDNIYVKIGFIVISVVTLVFVWKEKRKLNNVREEEINS